jgi:high-affinity iron transporter
MFAAALIVFRESLEAALFVGIVAAATRQLAGRGRWLSAGVSLGVLGALVMGFAAQHVSDWFDGLGQDVLNIVVLSVALVMLLWHCIWVAAHSREMANDARRLGQSVQQGQRRPWALLVAVALAVLREGAETVLFVSGAITGTETSTGSVVAAVIVGVALGAAAGLVIYSGLARISPRHLFTTTNVLIAILAGSIGSQLVKSLAQAGFIERWTSPLWDTSQWLSPESAIGTLLHALVGYDARPSAAQLGSYLAVLALIFFGNRLLRPRPQTAR